MRPQKEYDDDADAALPTFVRFADLKRCGIVKNWPALLRLVDQEHFPEGVWLGRNTRAWRLGDVEAWLDARPSARKVMPGRNKQQEVEAV